MKWTRRVPVGLLLVTTGCVYYNGIYNAKAAARDGDARLRRGGEGEATTFFQQSAANAESVLVRHPQSTWRARALYLAGRGAALGGQCDRAVGRLTEFLTLTSTETADRDRARVALASCDVRSSRVGLARARLDSVVDVRDATTAHQARVWAARAALAAGDRDAVAQYLSDTDESTLPWELVLASLSAQEYVRVESLLVQRAVHADYRDDVPRVLRDLWAAEQFAAVDRVVRQYDASRVRDVNRAALHFAAGELHLRAGHDSVARWHLAAVRTLAGRDTVLALEAAARLHYLAMMHAASLYEIDTMSSQQDAAIRRLAFSKRVGEQLLLVRLFAQQDDATGASHYLAAEIARDSLRAPTLAVSLFMHVARDIPTSPLAPFAWYAAGLLQPDSAPLWNARVRRDYGNSAIAAALTGGDPGTRADFATTPPLLLLRWNETLRVWSDSVRKLRLPPKSGTTTGGRP